jgi:MFS family permease
MTLGEKVMIGYALIMAFYYFGDTTVGYIVPVVMTEQLKSSALMGWVFAFSSVVGLVADLILPQLFSKKNFRFFAPAAFLTAILFPLSFLLLPSALWSFLLAMAIWGLYYELARFSHFSFIHQTLKPAQHDLGWGILQTFQSFILLIAPIFAIYVLEKQENLPFVMSIIFFGMGLTGYFFLKGAFLKKKLEAATEDTQHPTSRLHEIRVWALLLRKIWPLCLFLLSLTILDSSFWVVGALLSEQLRGDGFLGSFVITAYVFPSVFMSLIARQISKPLGKKRTAFVSAFIGCLILIVGGLLVHGSTFVLVILAAATFLSISYPEMYAVFEDFVARLDQNANHMIGLEGSSISIGYVLGPILAGSLGAMIGYQRTLVAVAAIFLVSTIIAAVKVPRKVLLPQKELSTVDE